MEDVTVCAVRESEVEGWVVVGWYIKDTVEGEVDVGDVGDGEVCPIEFDVVADAAEDVGLVLAVRSLVKKNFRK